MANKTIKMAAVAASVLAAMAGANAQAATINTASATASGLVASERTFASSGYDVSLGASAALKVTSSSGYTDNDIMTFTLSGATFKDATDYRLYVVSMAAGGTLFDARAVGSTLLGGNDSNKVAFRLASGTISPNTQFVLGASTTKATIPSLNLLDLASDAKATLSYSVTSGFGQSIDSATAKTLFTGSTQFTATDTDQSKTVSLENSRLNFGTASGKPIVVSSSSFKLAETSGSLLGDITLGSDDMIDVTLTGDMTGVESVMIDNTAFTVTGNTATGSVRADWAWTSSTGGNVGLDITVDGETELDARSWDLGVAINFDSFDTATLLSATNDHGSWTVNKLNAVVSHMSLNASGFISWLKVVNESNVSADVEAVATWTETVNGVATSGQSEEAVSLGTIAAESVTTISEAAILEAIGKSDAEGVLDVSLNLNIDAPDEEVHIVAEKKASNSRQVSPVYYGAGRSMRQ